MTTEYLQELEQSTSGSAPQGSLFINNTSYSGADIKLVVHVYDDGKLNERNTDQLLEDLSETIAAQASAESKVASITAKLQSVHIETPEYFNLTRQLTQAQADVIRLGSIAAATEQMYSYKGLKSSTISTKVLAEVQTLSISTHRVKEPVRACGKVYPVGFCRGQREIAGSIIFTVFNEHVLYELLEAHPSDFDSMNYSSSLLDQMPPMDITIAFANEYGHTSRMAIYGVEFINEGQTMSIEDIITENVVNYVARDFDPMRSVAHKKMDESSRMVAEWVPMRASDLMLEEDYQNAKTMNNPFERFYRRSNPFM